MSVEITIDGAKVRGEPNQTILEVAKRNGVHIPTLCNHPHLRATGACRICVVDLAKYFLNFTTAESCGKCSPCRNGLQRMLETLTKITEGRGNESDLADLREISAAVADASLCALGRGAPNPVLTTMKYFPEEYASHVSEKRCPAHGCKAMIKGYVVDESVCVGCSLCAGKCPTNSISLGSGKAEIDAATCIRCGQCAGECTFGAIKEEW